MTGSGLKKADKLLKRPEFVNLSKKGRSKSDRYFIVAYRFNNLDRTRLGITVTRKVGNAVVRNRIKRIVREYFRLNRQRIRGHLDINIIAKNAASGLPSKKAYDSLHRILDRINEGL